MNKISKKEKDKVRGLNSNLVTNGPEPKNKNKHSSPDKIRRLQRIIKIFALNNTKKINIFSETKENIWKIRTQIIKQLIFSIVFQNFVKIKKKKFGI